MKTLPSVRCELKDFQLARIQRFWLIATLAMAACKTPSYVEEELATTPESTLPFASEVSFFISENYQDQPINCVAVSKFRLEHEDEGYSDIDQAGIIRKSVYGVLSAKNYQVIELVRVDFKADELEEYAEGALLKSLDCDALIRGEVLAFKNDYFVTYSVTTVELRLTLVDEAGSELWSARHAASSHEGAMPLSPLSLLAGIFTAATNQQDEVAFQMVDAVARRLLKTLPDRAVQNSADDAIGNIINTKVVNQNNTEAAATKTVGEVREQENSMQLLSRGAYEQALAAAIAEIEADTSNGEAYLIAAKASLLLSDTTAAIDYSLSALANGQTTSSTYSGLGVAYLKSKNRRMAKASFQKAVELDPLSSQAQFNLALVSELEKEMPQAADYYFKAGTLALRARELSRVHKALKALKRLSLDNPSAQNRFIDLGKQVQIALAN